MTTKLARMSFTVTQCYTRCIVISHMILFLAYAACFGCNNRCSVPSLPQPVAISIALYPVSELGLNEPTVVEVKPANLDQILHLIRPVQCITGQIDKEVHVLVSEMVLAYNDGSHIKIYVRWIGKNPAAVSFDDNEYYWGGNSRNADGVVELLRILKTQ